MVVYILEKVPVSLRGELSRWMLEPRTGVFVGSLSAMVREKLWEKVCKEAKNGRVIMVHSCNNQQGYCMRTAGDASRQVVDIEGLQMIMIPSRSQ
jgi:CRISPR-associated protein Cas2